MATKRLDVLEDILEDIDHEAPADEDVEEDAPEENVFEEEAPEEDASEKDESDLGVAASHLMNAFTELLLAFRHAMSALPSGGMNAPDLESLKLRVRAEALDDIAAALRDEMKIVRREAIDDPEAAVARMTALAEVLRAVEKQADHARARADVSDYSETEDPHNSDVAHEWARNPRGDLKRVPLEVEEE